MESSCSIPDLEVMDYTTSRTLSEESDETKSVKPSFPPPPQKEAGGGNRIRGKNFTARRTPVKGMRGYGTGKFYCRINILLLIYY